MKKALLAILFFFSISILLSSFSNPGGPDFKMPWKAAGLTERQAAAHLLNRFTFGATPGQIDELLKTGLEKWFEQQLEGKLNDDSLNEKLKEYDALKMSNQQIINTFPRQARILKMAVEDGVINKDSVDKSDKAAYRDMLQDYMQQKGLRREQELYRQFANQKILSAAYSNNQLQQVLTDFWYNHFNVSATKNDCAQFIPVYEREVIRPNTSGKFYDLLLATAQSPAMLFYLDNFNSAGMNAESEAQAQKQQQRLEKMQQEVMEGSTDTAKTKQLETLKKRKNNLGLNENYAREIMELHTLGVDGGYTQADVTEAARILTGWTVYPLEGLGPSNFARKLIDKFGEENLIKKGFVHQGDFLFAMNRHDDKEKKVLGKTFPAGGGYTEGVALINMLAHHPATAKFISKKLAVRFVSDNPPQSLIDKMAQSFTSSDGNIKQVLITMVSSPEFWQKEALREKTKSPFELVISTVRSLNADISMPFMLYQQISKMGQKLYYYQAPTGFPDKGQYWINTGSLLNRMKFGLAFAAQKIPGVSFNLAALNNNHEPESALAALKVYSKIMMPERDVEATIKRLEPMVNDPALQQKVTAAADKNAPPADMMEAGNDKPDALSNKNMSEEKLARQMLRKKGAGEMNSPMLGGNNTMLAQVVGIIIGSPEFQRR
jgi:uncharacterized protein (DUF1800 family)